MASRSAGGSSVGPAWEQPGAGWISSLAQTTWAVLASPVTFFRTMPVTGGLGRPLGYAVIVGTIGFIALVPNLALNRVTRGLLGSPLKIAIGMAVMLAHGPLSMITNLFLAAGLVHVVLMLLGWNERGFEATFRACAYSAAAMVLYLIPFCGMLITPAYFLVLVVLALVETHGITRLSAVTATLLPLVVFCLCSGAGLFMASRLLPSLGQRARPSSELAATPSPPGTVSGIPGQTPARPSNDLAATPRTAESASALRSETLGTAIYFADGFALPGRIDRLDNGVVSPDYTRERHAIHSVAVASDGTVYFCDANTVAVMRLDNQQEVMVHRHTTYVRDVGVDSKGRVYFSEATGAGGDGTIYRIERGEAKPFYTVRLSHVDGSWAGNFALDGKDRLWLSSGNRVPASVYKVESGVPKRVYDAPEGSIAGFFIEGDGRAIVYADFEKRIYRVRMPSKERETLYFAPSAQHLSAVAALRR
jgi:streptogramin lyase